MNDRNKKLIRNSSAEFLICTSQADEQSIEARYENETIWLTQQLMATLFGVGVNTINYHLKEVVGSGEVQSEATIRNFPIVQTEGRRQVAGRWISITLRPSLVLRQHFASSTTSPRTRRRINRMRVRFILGGGGL